jgi:diguanylate cyclase (GGDEF)-like protein
VGIGIEAALASQVVQAVGTCLTATLTLLLARSVRREYVWQWALGWSALAASLVLAVALAATPAWAPALIPLHLWGQYLFLLFLIRGCLQFSGGEPLGRRTLAAAFAGGFVLAIAISAAAAGRQDVVLAWHAPVMTGGFLVAFRALRPALVASRSGVGLRVAAVALLLLALWFVHYVPALAYAHAVGLPEGPAYLEYRALFDLVLQTALGFGVVIVVLESLWKDFERSNEELREARDRLEFQARVDPLTHALNRHAFYSLASASSRRWSQGCAVLFDVDHLKQLNDTRGHAAGDAAIRAAARAIRSVIRADDLLFRWGGDEFLVLLFGVSEGEARKRMQLLDDRSGADADPESGRLSWGVARFDEHVPLGAAVELADEDMYAARARARAAGSEVGVG